MYRFIGKFGRPLLGACAAALVLAGTSGATHLGSLQLGHANTSTEATSLTANLASPVLKVVNQGSAAALRGDAQNGIGVNGVSVSGTGQQGQTQTGIGLLGIHSATTGVNPGVQGQTSSTDPLGAGVVGKNTGGGPGVRAIVNAGVPPLAVNSNAKVANLNADLLDGLDSSSLQNRVSGGCGAGSAIRVVNANGTVSCEPVGGGGVWSLSGNADTSPGTNFLGTTDNHALELKVNGNRALRLEPDANSPNLIGGAAGNAVQPGSVGATISGGGGLLGVSFNLVTDNFGTIGGGHGNVAGDQDPSNDPTTASHATVGGGENNHADRAFAVVGGGQANTAHSFGTVGGGYTNTAGGLFSAVPGGDSNTAAGDRSFAAGTRASANHQGSFVWGDSTGFPAEVTSTAPDQVTMRASGGVRLFSSPDTTSANAPGIQLLPGTSALAPAGNSQSLEFRAGGARALRLEPKPISPNVIGGSSSNVVQAGAAGATIGGGGNSSGVNVVTDDYGYVGGGQANVAGDGDAAPNGATSATVGGGASNTASANWSAVGGGLSNTASGTSSHVGGGTSNTASASWAAVGGGTGNSASGPYSAIPGGSLNAALGDRSLAAGNRAKANHQGTFVWADTTNADFASTEANQFLVRASGGAKIVRGTSSFHGTGAALQVEHAGTEGEAAWLRIVGSASTAPVLNLLKHPSGTGNFLTCTNFDGTSTAVKCHIDADGTFVGGSDFAESLPARGGKAGYEPGDVLVASLSHPGEVARSGKRFDRAVIGVYSTRPAVLGADKGGITRIGKNDVPVAITGIVPVKVTADNGPIRPGDLLTSSSRRGRAMNAGRNPAVGTVLGKSLGVLMRGQGVVRALVMLR